MKKYLTLLLATMIIFTASSCSDVDNTDQPPLASNSVIVTDDSIPDVAPNLSGMVTNISYVREGMTMLLETSGKNNNSPEGKVYVSVTSRTIVENSAKEKYTSFNDIKLGDTLSVWYLGNSTATTPMYAVASGVRVMSSVDSLLSVKLNNSVIMATSVESLVSNSDITTQLYGSYMVAEAGGRLEFDFVNTSPLHYAVKLVPTNKELRETNTILFDFGREMIHTLPQDIAEGEYIAEVTAVYSEAQSNYYIFTLCVQ